MFNNYWMNYAIARGATPDMLNSPPLTAEQAKVYSTMFKELGDYNQSNSKAALQMNLTRTKETADILQTMMDNRRALEVQQMRSATDIEKQAMKSRVDLLKARAKLDIETSVSPFGPHEDAIELGKRARASSRVPGAGLYTALDAYTTKVNSDPVLRETHRQSLPASINKMLQAFVGPEVNLTNVDLDELAERYKDHPNVDGIIQRLREARTILQTTDMHKQNFTKRAAEMEAIAKEAAGMRDGPLTPEKAAEFKQRMVAASDDAIKSVAQVFTGSSTTTPQTLAKSIEDMTQESEFYTALQDKLLAYMKKMDSTTPGNNPAANLVADPAFQAWAKDNGFDNLGSAVLDENGRAQNYVKGADDAAAFSLFYFQTQHPERYKKLFGRGGASHTQEARQRVEITLPASPDTLAKFDVSGETGNPLFAYIKDVENGTRRYLTPDELLSETVDLSGPELRVAHGDGYMVVYDPSGTRLEGEGEGPRAAIVTPDGSIMALNDEKQIAEIAATAEPAVLNRGGAAEAPTSIGKLVGAYSDDSKDGVVLQSEDDFDALKAQLPSKAAGLVQYTDKAPGDVPIYGYIQKRHAGWAFDIQPNQSRVVLADGTTMDVDNDNMYVIDEPAPSLREVIHARQAKKTAESARETMAQRRAREEQAVAEGDPADAPLRPGELPPEQAPLDDPLQETGLAAAKDKRLLKLTGKRTKAKQRNIDLLGEAVDKLSDDASRQALRADARYGKGKATAADMYEADLNKAAMDQQAAAIKQQLKGVGPMPAAQVGDIRPMIAPKRPKQPGQSFGDLIGAVAPVQGDIIGDAFNNVEDAPPGATRAAYSQLKDRSKFVSAMRPPAMRKKKPNPSASTAGVTKDME